MSDYNFDWSNVGLGDSGGFNAGYQVPPPNSNDPYGLFPATAPQGGQPPDPYSGYFGASGATSTDPLGLGSSGSYGNPSQDYLDPNSPNYGLPGAAAGGGGFHIPGLTNKDGSINPLGLLSLLGPLLSAGLGYNATKHATNQMTGAITQANNAITGLAQQSTGNYTPYMQAGQKALGNLTQYQYHPPTYSILGSGAGTGGKG